MGESLARSPSPEASGFDAHWHCSFSLKQWKFSTAMLPAEVGPREFDSGCGVDVVCCGLQVTSMASR
ncbi:TPA: hypothetical protein N0F65_004556 [Lagenidium giganteum]|uniref:Uncharacterized protein n=1 Tax=Lagenidium giganteum TaxID=4803 RepID=A0AAV2Z8Y4_9STRA|nr:TPA: hypothetical protein N0F65_004556 [Lagenidium giganteum]